MSYVKKKRKKYIYIYVKASDVISVFTTRDWIPAISTTVKSTRLPAAPPFNRARKKLAETPLNVSSRFHPHIRTHPTDNRDSNENINFSRKSDPSFSFSLIPFERASKAAKETRYGGNALAARGQAISSCSTTGSHFRFRPSNDVLISAVTPLLSSRNDFS